jgi:DNA-binding transcriptional MerR regulator
MAKLLYSMGEVTEMFDVNASLIRYWESKFDCIKPHKNKKGNRMFTPSDIENLKLIYHLVKEKGMTLEGANMAMKRRGKSVQRDVSILERLQHIRAMLLEIRESLGDDTPAEYEAPIEAMAELISDVEEQAQAEVVSGVTTKEELVEETKEEVVEETPRRRGRPRKVVEHSEAEETPQSVTRRKPKAKRAEEHKELFPFYEQSLF